MQRENRRLAAIVAVDIAGYSRLIGRDEEGTLRRLRAHRAELIDPLVEQHAGRIANTAGDSLLLEFPSAVDAVRCAIAIQDGMRRRNLDVQESLQIRWRIGVNVGDVVAQGADLLGDGVNIAARLQEISEAGGVTLSDDAHRQVRGRIEAKFVDDGPQSLKNITEDVRVWRLCGDGGGPPAVTTGRPANAAKSSKPAIAVLPFDNLSGEGEQDFFADGISEDIITALARFHSLDVIGRNSSFKYKGQSVDLKLVSQELSARYILEGSVRKSGSKVRITAQLIDGPADRHIWADRFDRELADVFEVQDEIAEIIVATLVHKVDSEETEKRMRSARTDGDAYDCYLTGREHFFARTKQSSQKSLELIERAIERDPKFSRAHGFKAWIKAYCARYGWSDDPDCCLDVALQSALTALSLDPSDYDAHWRLAVVYLQRRQFEKAEVEYNKALSLNPNHAGFLAEMSSALILLGRPEDAITQLEQAKHINPQYPEWFTASLGWAHYHAGHPDEALNVLSALNDPPAVFRLFLAATYARLDRPREAGREVNKILQQDPEFTLARLDNLPFRNQADHTKLIDDLRLAGVP